MSRRSITVIGSTWVTDRCILPSKNSFYKEIINFEVEFTYLFIQSASLTFVIQSETQSVNQ